MDIHVSFNRFLDINDVMPGYDEYADQLTPEQFIKTFWKDASVEMRGCMIDFILEHPFEGDIKYLSQWSDHLRRTYGIIN